MSNTYAVREDDKGHLVIRQFTGDDGRSGPWKDFARTFGTLSEHDAENIARAMNEAEARYEASRNT